MANTVLIVMVVAVLALSLFQAVQFAGISGAVAGLSARTTGGATATQGSTGAIDMTGWTADEKMNYEMHGIIPARAGGGSAGSPPPTMVGGC